MGKTIVLLTTLNPKSPIPNAASIMAHSPESVLFLRFPGRNKLVEGALDAVEERIESWCRGELRGLYELEKDLQLSHQPVGPPNKPQIEVLPVNDFLESAQEVASQIHELSKSVGDVEIRIDVNSGRKEDVANLVRHASKVLDVDFSIWYTDVGTGHSAEIETKRNETGRPPIDPLTRIWLGGYPIISLDSVIDVNSSRGGFLSAFLDSVENAVKTTEKQGRILVEKELAEGDISIDRDGFLHDGKTNDISVFTVPEDLLDETNGIWLEKISGLAIAEAWDCETVYVGVGIGSNNRKERIGNGAAKLRFAQYRDDRAELVGLLGTYTIPDEFPNIVGDGNQFANWVKREYEKLPLSFRNEFLRHSKRRDLDAFAQTQEYAIFVECKLSRGMKEEHQEQKKSQLDSLVLSIGSHRHRLTILADKAGEELSKTSKYDFVTPWHLLRRPDELLQSVIGRRTVSEPNRAKRMSLKEKKKALRKRTIEIVAAGGWKGWIPTIGEAPPPFVGDAPIEHRYYCPDCNKTFATKGPLKSHFKETGHACYKCEECEKSLIGEPDVVNHGEETEHRKIGGICYDLNKLRTPIGKKHKECQERLIKSGVYQKAIELGWSKEQFAKEIQKEAGIPWRVLFGARPRRATLQKLFNDREPGLVRFVQDDDGGWYASHPDEGNEEE